MPQAVKEMTLLSKDETAMVPANQAGSVIEKLIELAKDPAIDVAKIDKLIDANERAMAHMAKAAFDAAFSAMQGEMPTISERGEILVNGVLRSKYAKYEDIIEVIRPILARHGFAIRHRNEQKDGIVTVVGILSHKAGHSEEDRFEFQPDNSGGKQPIQQVGSTRAYGQRYTTISLVNIVTKGEDNDGAGVGEELPDGFQDWWDDLKLTAGDGLVALKAAWDGSPKPFKAFVAKVNPTGWEKLKQVAAKAGA